MLQLDTNAKNSPPVLSNISVPTYIGPRMNGAMIHVPVGDQGVLVLIAGQTTMVPTPYGVGIPKANEGNTNINNSFVDIYDIQTGYWFRQQTFGEDGSYFYIGAVLILRQVYQLFQQGDQIFARFLLLRLIRVHSISSWLLALVRLCPIFCY
jgi:hypothetical protein